MVENMADAVSLARQGSDEGKAYLYESTYRKAYYVALKHMKNEDDACDVVQDAYIKAFDRIDQLADDGKFDSWLNTIVASTALDALKKKKPMLFSQMSKEDDEDYDVSERFEADYSKQPEVVIDQNETSRLVQEIIGELSDEQRVCVTMYYIQEMSVKEISSVLDVPDNTVMSRLHYARKNIEKKVKELEKKGTKLYALAPIPFLLLLLHSEADACEATAVAGLYATTVGLGTTASEAAVGVGAASSAGLGAGATATGMSLGAKIAIGIVSAVVVVGGAVGVGVVAYNNVYENEADEKIEKELDEALQDALAEEMNGSNSTPDDKVTEPLNVNLDTRSNEERAPGQPFVAVTYPIFSVESAGYDQLKQRLSQISNEYKIKCDNFFEENRNLAARYPAMNESDKMILRCEPKLGTCNDEYYSFCITEAEIDSGSTPIETRGYVLDPKTGEDIDISYFVPDRVKLAELFKQGYYNSDITKYNNDAERNFFERIKTDPSYHYNYYVTDSEIVVILNGMDAFNASRPLANVECKIPRDGVNVK